MFLRITQIEPVDKHLKPLALGLRFLPALAHFGSRVEFAAILALEKEQMRLAVIVGQCGLPAVAYTCQHGHHPNQPRMFMEKRHIAHSTQADGYVDAHKPYIAGSTVEYAAKLGKLAGKARQLAVGAVVAVGPHQQEHPQQRYPYITVIKAYRSAYTQKHRRYGHYIRVNTKLAEQPCPGKTYGPVKAKVDILLGIARFKRRTVLFSNALKHLHCSLTHL